VPTITTISYTRPGISAPVYLTTNITNPPWEIREMSISEKKTDDGDSIFYLQFGNVLPGSYEYKVRVGESGWVLDEKHPISEPSTCGELLQSL
jgi:hypothetical protein